MELPPPPKVCKSKPKPKVNFGEDGSKPDDARVAYRMTDVALDQANARLDQCEAWIKSVRDRYSGAASK